MDINPRAQLAQETATQKFVDCQDPLIRAAALATVYRDSSIRPFEESDEPWNEVSQRNTPKTSRWQSTPLAHYQQATKYLLSRKAEVFLYRVPLPPEATPSAPTQAVTTKTPLSK
ncbi:hypothetical protein TNCV_1443081 [Trichonephila clavipes]|nr:hypothetical protein TNCV_1443081 [Trichonephila clavipes]